MARPGRAAGQQQPPPQSRTARPGPWSAWPEQTCRRSAVCFTRFRREGRRDSGPGRTQTWDGNRMRVFFPSAAFSASSCCRTRREVVGERARSVVRRPSSPRQATAHAGLDFRWQRCQRAFLAGLALWLRGVAPRKGPWPALNAALGHVKVHRHIDVMVRLLCQPGALIGDRLGHDRNRTLFIIR